MNTVLKTFLSMSCSGSLLILALFLGKRFWKDKISRQWQYYIWLIVILRLLLPFGPDTTLMGKLYQAAGQAAAPLPREQNPADNPGGAGVPAAGLEPGGGEPDGPAENPAAARPLQDIVLLVRHAWLVWLAAALGMLIRKATIYQGFVQYIRAGLTPVSSVEVLDRLSAAAERAGVKKPVELGVNTLVSSPMLIGFFHPCIVLPGADLSEKDFQYTVLHELTHCKRRDMFCKWLVQVTVCLHWFNPLVHLMGREITKACEFSCDEAVLAETGCDSARDYGETLLNAMAAVGRYRADSGAVTLSENKQLLKERIHAIMNYKKKSAAIRLLTGVLTLCMIFGAVFIGVYPSAAAAGIPEPAGTAGSVLAQADGSPEMETLDIKGTTYYLVCSEAQLRAIGTGAYGMERNYMQQADIQLSADEWTPIGTWEHPFTGTFNGNGFEIAGLTMTDPDAKIIGLFGVAQAAHIYNVTLRDYDIMSAGRNASEKSVGAVLAVGQGSCSYGNLVYPKETSAADPGRADGASLAERYYEAGSLPLFQIAFPRLDGKEQAAWLEKLYTGGDFAFFSAAARSLGEDSPLAAAFAEKAYADGKTAFFSILAGRMDEAELNLWLDRALEDGRWDFQSMLFDKLDMDDEKAAQEKEWTERQMAEYGAAGVAYDGGNYYYQGQLVNIFLDVRPGKSFYTLDLNPEGTVNIKIIRGENGQVTGAACMTEAEAAELLEDMAD